MSKSLKNCFTCINNIEGKCTKFYDYNLNGKKYLFPINKSYYLCGGLKYSNTIENIKFIDVNKKID